MEKLTVSFKLKPSQGACRHIVRGCISAFTWGVTWHLPVLTSSAPSVTLSGPHYSGYTAHACQHLWGTKGKTCHIFRGITGLIPSPLWANNARHRGGTPLWTQEQGSTSLHSCSDLWQAGGHIALYWDSEGGCWSPQWQVLTQFLGLENEGRILPSAMSR